MDIDRDDQQARNQALNRVVQEAEALAMWVELQAGYKAEKPPLNEALSDLKQVMGQELEPDPGGNGVWAKKGVVKDRQPSLGDKELRHGRKSRSKKFNGYKRHIATVLGSGLIVGARALAANGAEHEAVEALLEDVRRQGALGALYIDRGYLASEEVEVVRESGGKVYCKPWPARNQGRFTTADFEIRLAEKQVVCPAGVGVEFATGQLHEAFPAQRSGSCSLSACCRTAREGTGRSLTLHPQEELLLELRARRQSSEGRRELRQQVEVGHRLARTGQKQGAKARY